LKNHRNPAAFWLPFHTFLFPKPLSVTVAFKEAKPFHEGFYGKKKSRDKLPAVQAMNKRRDAILKDVVETAPTKHPAYRLDVVAHYVKKLRVSRDVIRSDLRKLREDPEFEAAYQKLLPLEKDYLPKAPGIRPKTKAELATIRKHLFDMTAEERVAFGGDHIDLYAGLLGTSRQIATKRIRQLQTIDPRTSEAFNELAMTTTRGRQKHRAKTTLQGLETRLYAGREVKGKPPRSRKKEEPEENS